MSLEIEVMKRSNKLITKYTNWYDFSKKFLLLWFPDEILTAVMRWWFPEEELIMSYYCCDFPTKFLLAKTIAVVSRSFPKKFFIIADFPTKISYCFDEVMISRRRSSYCCDFQTKFLLMKKYRCDFAFLLLWFPKVVESS